MGSAQSEVERIRAERELKEMRSLIADLKDEDWQVRLKAAGTLGKVRKTDEMIEEGVPALIAAVRDPNDFVRKTAVPALGDVGPQAKAAVGVLVELLTDPDPQMRRSAAYSLGKIGHHAAPAVEPLIDLLRDPDKEIRKAVAWALGIIGPEAVPRLATACTDRVTEVRAGCVFALGTIGPNAIAALPQLRQCLLDPEVEVRYNAAKAIGNLRAAKEAEQAVEPLIRLLDDTDPDVRWVAAEALRKIGTEQAMEAWLRYEAQPTTLDLLKQLFNDDKQIRIDAAENLAKSITPDDASHVAELKRGLQDQLWKVRAAVAEALAKIGPGASGATKSLKKALRDEHEKVRAAAAHALGRIGPEAEIAVVRLIKRLNDEHKEVRTAAGVALELIGTTEAVKALESFTWE
ncbi:MAG: HEAT repeat domain-containing protein [Bdellovibrionales bacterium]|nr:HEAT repeat domain-containing protein [Bdellovibrionales bacterium]